MADEPIASLVIDVIANLKINKSQTAKAVQEIKDSVEKGSQKGTVFSDIQKDAEKSAFSISKFAGIVKGAMKSAGKFVEKTPFGKLALHIKDTVKSLGGFMAAIKRIAIYRGIRAALKAITQGFQEGRENAYQWALVNGNQFARSMDMIATSMLYLKNSIGAMTMPLTNYLAPIIDRLVDRFVDLINVVNQFIATITGASSWTRALKYPTQYAEAVGGAAKEIKNQLLGFDELNILNAPSGGGGAAALDYGNMFQEMQLSLENLNFSKALKEAIKNSDWRGVGTLLAGKFNSMVEKIPSLELADALGKKVNNALTLVHTLLNELDFYQVGEKIGQFVSNIKLNWSMIGASWIRWHTNMLDALLGLVSNVNWGNVGSAIGGFIRGVFDEFRTWLASIDWYQKAYDLTQSFISMVKGLDILGIARSIASALIEAVKQALQLVAQSLQGTKLFSNPIQVNALGEPVFSPTAPYIPSPAVSPVTNRSHAGGGGRTYDPNMMASGGFPNQGSMFIAGESGAELVAQIGGRTGVMNTDQMAQSLSSANEGVINAIAAMGNAVVSAINRKDTSININDVRKAITTMNMRYGV